MSTPSVDITEIDGALGVLPGTGTKARAVAGVSEKGPFYPIAFADPKKLEAVFGRGPGPSAAANVIAQYGVAVLFCRTGAAVNGDYLDEVDAANGTISAISNVAVSGTSDFSDNSSVPLLGGSWRVYALNGGTRGTPGIILQVFRDAGDGAGFVSVGVYSLGSNVNFAVGSGSGLNLALSAGTIVAGDVATFTTTAPVPASEGTLEVTGAGTSVPTLGGGSGDYAHPHDSFEGYWECTEGGTIGQDGIKYVWSLDDNRTPEAETQLGTANFVQFPNSGVRINFGAGTVTKGTIIRFPTKEPRWNTTQLAAAIDLLKEHAIPWDGCHVVGDIDPTAFDVIDAKFQDKRHYWLGSTRLPVGAETDADYQQSIGAAFASKATRVGGLSMGADEPVDSLTGRKYRRPAMFAISAMDASVTEEVNIAQLDRPGGNLTGSNLKTELGNAKHHDERFDVGGDDMRFITLRTDADYQGVYVNRMRCFSPLGSDFYLIPHRRVMNLAHVTIMAYFKKRLSKGVRVSKKTGYLLSTERVSMQNGATKALNDVLLAKPKASGVRVVLSETDNVLSTRKVTGKYFVIPLAYIENFELEGGFENPALNIIQVG